MALEKPKIAFLGLGAMDFGIAKNVIKLSYPVTGFDIRAQLSNDFQPLPELCLLLPENAFKMLHAWFLW